MFYGSLWSNKSKIPYIWGRKRLGPKAVYIVTRETEFCLNEEKKHPMIYIVCDNYCILKTPTDNTRNSQT